ncbi:hypothetical protein BDZ88DRAFT_27670 [Geranomyces variabilis]|nr:hypothetical protein BDZ88DRAFT_27670 [Geranomyces variabilis]
MACRRRGTFDGFLNLKRARVKGVNHALYSTAWQGGVRQGLPLSEMLQALKTLETSLPDKSPKAPKMLDMLVYLESRTRCVLYVSMFFFWVPALTTTFPKVSILVRLWALWQVLESFLNNLQAMNRPKSTPGFHSPTPPCQAHLLQVGQAQNPAVTTGMAGLSKHK